MINYVNGLSVVCLWIIVIKVLRKNDLFERLLKRTDLRIVYSCDGDCENRVSRWPLLPYLSGARTLSITTNIIVTFSITIKNTTLSIASLSIMALDTVDTVMLSVVMPSVVMPSVVMPSVVMASVVMLNVIILIVVAPSKFILAPWKLR